MSEVETVPASPGAEPVPVLEVVEPELRYEYQPTDSSGRPIGGKQVIKYRTQDDLNQRWEEQNTLLVRKLREETRKNRLGIQDEVTPDGPKFRNPLEFKRRELTADERTELSRSLLDPDRLHEASDMFFEAAVGVKPADLTKTLREMQEDNLRFKAQVECDAFLTSNPQYYRCQENYEAITSWMVRKGLEPVRENFQAAYQTLKNDGILVDGDAPPVPVVLAPVLVPAPGGDVIAPLAVAPPVSEVPAIPATETRLASGLTRNQSANTGTTPALADQITYELIDPRTGNKTVLKGLQAVNAMPSGEFKRRLETIRGFSATVDRLERDAAVAKQTRQRM